MITADQILVHCVGDFWTQSDWMAQNKTKAAFPAFCHALVYSLGFLLFSPSMAALAVIFGTHFLIDRYRLARYIVWAKNFLAPKTWWKRIGKDWSPTDNQTAKCWLTWQEMRPADSTLTSLDEIGLVKKFRMLPFAECAATGYPPSTPVWLSVWLMIVADNILHWIINGAALRYL